MVAFLGKSRFDAPRCSSEEEGSTHTRLPFFAGSWGLVDVIFTNSPSLLSPVRLLWFELDSTALCGGSTAGECFGKSGFVDVGERFE
jgi:hypothetical protein